MGTNKQIHVDLVSATEDVLTTVYLIWQQSKIPGYTIQQAKQETSHQEKVKLLQTLIELDVPILENIELIFHIQNVPIAWREQAVRHRIGARMGDSVGIDMIPDLDQSVWWSESMRIKSMENFFDNGDYYLPESIQNNHRAKIAYYSTLKTIQTNYFYLVSVLGIPMEDARNLIPLGATHSITWRLNIKSLIHIIGKRSCWILQAGLWVPVIQGMIESLREKFNTLFDQVAHPPCIKNNKFKSCPFNEENVRRIEGKDALPVCPIWFDKVYRMREKSNYINIKNLIEDIYSKTHKNSESKFLDYAEDYERRLNLYSHIWNFKLTEI